VAGSQVVLGGDSALITESGDRSIGQPKVFERDGLLFGSSGEMRVGQLIRHVLDLPTPRPGQDAEEFVVRDLCTVLHAFLDREAAELLPKPDSEDELWSLLLVAGGRLFRLGSHFSVSESATGYDAIGGGSPLALGSLASTEDQPPRRRVELALLAAERHHGSVLAPFTILERGDGESPERDVSPSSA
jgi:hypothetical protein